MSDYNQALVSAVNFAVANMGARAKTEEELAEGRRAVHEIVDELRADGVTDDRVADELVRHTQKLIEDHTALEATAHVAK